VNRRDTDKLTVWQLKELRAGKTAHLATIDRNTAFKLKT
jgi:hypothetical protein